MPAAPDPESLPTLAERLEAAGFAGAGFWERPRPIDLRYVDDPPWLSQDARPRNHQQVWFRATADSR